MMLTEDGGIVELKAVPSGSPALVSGAAQPIEPSQATVTGNNGDMSPKSPKSATAAMAVGAAAGAAAIGAVARPADEPEEPIPTGPVEAPQGVGSQGGGLTSPHSKKASIGARSEAGDTTYSRLSQDSTMSTESSRKARLVSFVPAGADDMEIPEEEPIPAPQSPWAPPPLAPPPNIVRKGSFGQD